MEVPAALERVMPGDLLRSPPVVSLIFANIVTIVLAVLGNWDIATVMFVYWAQSIVIGIFTVLTLLTADIFRPEPPGPQPVPRNGKSRAIPIANPWAARIFLAAFFTVHYGLFHWAYYSFIVESGMFGTVNFADPGIWLSCGLFLANHLYSFSAYRRNSGAESQDIGEVFFGPYRRIFPMHLTIIFGGILMLVLEFAGISSTLPVLVLFLVLKTVTDVSAHIAKHRPA